MAKKQDSNSMEGMRELNRQIREQDFSHVYLLWGEQDYLRSQNRNKLRTAILGDGDEMNSSYFTGSDFTADDVLSIAQTLPFFADRRVITLENTGLFGGRSAADPEKISEYLGHVPETTYLIFVQEKPNRTTRLYKQIKKYGFVLECATPDENTLRTWTGALFKKQGHRISLRAVDLFLSRTGDDMLNITHEADKLSSYCGSRQDITEEDVRAITSVRVRDRIFDMIGAITARDSRKAMQIYAELLTLQTPPQVILSLMIRQFNQLLQVGELSARGTPDSEIASMMGLNPYVVSRRIRPLLRGYSGDGLTRALQDCVQTDMDYKSGKIDPQIAVEKLIVTYSH